MIASAWVLALLALKVIVANAETLLSIGATIVDGIASFVLGQSLQSFIFRFLQLAIVLSIVGGAFRVMLGKDSFIVKQAASLLRALWPSTWKIALAVVRKLPSVVAGRRSVGHESKGKKGKH